MASSSTCTCYCRPIISAKSYVINRFVTPRGMQLILQGNPRLKQIPRIFVVRASAVDSSSNFVERVEKAWLISKVYIFFTYLYYLCVLFVCSYCQFQLSDQSTL